MPKPDLVILIDIPALNRLVDYLEGQEQGKVDAMATALDASNAKQKAAIGRLKTAVQTSKGTT